MHKNKVEDDLVRRDCNLKKNGLFSRVSVHFGEIPGNCLQLFHVRAQVFCQKLMFKQFRSREKALLYNAP